MNNEAHTPSNREMTRNRLRLRRDLLMAFTGAAVTVAGALVFAGTFKPFHQRPPTAKECTTAAFQSVKDGVNGAAKTAQSSFHSWMKKVRFSYSQPDKKPGP